MKKIVTNDRIKKKLITEYREASVEESK